MEENQHGLREQFNRMQGWERRVVEHLFARKTMVRNPNEMFDEQLTYGQKVADRVASFGGSWSFIFVALGLLSLWIIYNATNGKPFDAYPFILLNLILSCLAAFQAPVIMMSQNRQAVKDRLDAQQDYEVNLKTELEVLAIHAKLDEAVCQRLVELQQVVATQAQALERVELALTQLLGSQQDTDL